MSYGLFDTIQSSFNTIGLVLLIAYRVRLNEYRAIQMEYMDF